MAAAAAPSPRFSTRCMKISSSRLTLLRMLSTSTPSARELHEQRIEALLLGDVGLERVLIDQAHAEAGERRRLPAAARAC